MPEEVDVACPGCNAVFSVPVEFCGEMAQCAECEVVFEIPKPENAADGNLTSTDTGAIKGVEADGDEATNTVRLSRTGIGMIPQVKDSFTFGATDLAAPKPAARKQPPRPAATPSVPPPPAKPAAPSAPATPGSGAKQFSSPPTVAEPSASQSKKEKIIVPAWTKIRMKKDEEVVGLRESTVFPAGIAVVATIIAAVSGGAGIALAKNMAVAAAVVLVVSAVAVAAVFFMAKGTSKMALVLTSLRAICVLGKKRLEITR